MFSKTKRFVVVKENFVEVKVLTIGRSPKISKGVCGLLSISRSKPEIGLMNVVCRSRLTDKGNKSNECRARLRNIRIVVDPCNIFNPIITTLKSSSHPSYSGPTV